MPRKDFHAKDKPFDEGTLTKLEIFQLYTREWLPVFLTRNPPHWKQIHIYDFFCGPGKDTDGVKGSPVRIVEELLIYRAYLASGAVTVHLHFYDSEADKVIALRQKVRSILTGIQNVVADIQTLPFDEAFVKALPTLNSAGAAKLVFLDPCGVNFVTPNVFGQIISSKVTDFMLFLPSSYLHRFRSVDSIVLKIDRPEDFFHVHKVTFAAFKSLKPTGNPYYMAPFSIKKKKGIYGIIFGSSKALGMDKFLTTTWGLAPGNGEANFDINRENFEVANPSFAHPEFSPPPTKLQAFEQYLEDAILAGNCPEESEIIEICFEHGVKRQHAVPVLEKLKAKEAIACDFRVPQIDRAHKIIVR